MTFLFWNVHRRPLLDMLARLVARHGVDVVILAEVPFAAVGSGMSA